MAMKQKVCPLRIIVTSDTHYHPQWTAALENAVADIAALQPDCLIHAGDVGEGLVGFENMLRLLRAIDCPRLVLPGNHDLWANAGIPSERLWSEKLPQLTRDYSAIWLEGEHWSHHGVGVCGTIGWYDYSGRHPDLNVSDEEYFARKRRYNADGDRITWQWNDIEFAALVGEAFSTRLAALDADPLIREVLVVTHVPAFVEAITRHPNDMSWNFSNAYFHNLTLGQRIVNSPKVKRVVSAHTHVGVTAQVSGAGGPIEMQVLPSDYGAPAYAILDYPD